MKIIKKTAIAIQARLGSTRYPGKINAKISGKTVLERVVSECEKTMKYVNRNTHRHGMLVKMYLLIPEGDDIKAPSNSIKIIRGSENDVLSRYLKVLEEDDEIEYVIRITSDCPLIPTSLINKVITVLNQGNFDFVSNSDPRIRTFWDGADVEGMSARILKYMGATFEDPYLREHVTKGLYVNDTPPWFTKAHIFSGVDMSDIKLSVDDINDLQKVTENVNSVNAKIEYWESINGKNGTYHF